MKKIIPYFFFIFFLSCSSNELSKVKKPEELKPVDQLYKIAISEFEAGNLQNSIDILKKIELNYSFTPYASKSTLMIAYIYYEAIDYIRSLEYLKKFKNLYPASKYISYSEFMTGLCLYEQIDAVSKDQTPAILSLKQFRYIIKNFPNTIYADEAKIKIDLINEQLAGKEMYVARYYISKEKWAAAILRLQIVIENYQNTIFIDEALHRMVEVNYRIGNIELAKKYAAILGYNYNDSDWYKKTYKIVGDKNYSVLNKENKKNLKEKLLSIFNFNKDD